MSRDICDIRMFPKIGGFYSKMDGVLLKTFEIS